MSGFLMGNVEREVIKILKSSSDIEKEITLSFKKEVTAPIVHPAIRYELLPNFVGFLYKMILDKEKLPSQEEYYLGYLKEYFNDVTPSSSRWYEYISKASKAYESLVRDLHFYFKLKESCLFDDVLIAYAFDIEVKHDIVVLKDGRFLGIQLFNGTDAQIPAKKKQLKSRRLGVRYPDFFFPLRGVLAKPVELGRDNHKVLMYSQEDVLTIARYLDKDIFDDRIKIEENYVPLSVEPNKRREQLSESPSKNSLLTLVTPKHSIIYVGGKEINSEWDEIKKKVRNGVKVEWVSPYQTEKDVEIESYGDLIRLHYWDKAGNYNLLLRDGIGILENKKVLDLADFETTFNLGQYLTEHATLNRHMIVEAGAGTGKTETMISRIIFLLHTKALKSLDHVVMITFTNEAANRMKTKLGDRLQAIFKITKNIKYLEWQEEVSRMRITTIPSFAKSIIQDYSTSVSLGKGFGIRSLKKQKQKIISEELNLYIEREGLETESIGVVREYDLIKFIESFWEEFDKKGIKIEGVKIDWGSGSDNRNIAFPVFDKLIREVLQSSMAKFEEFKIDEDAITLSDLTSKVSDLKPHIEKEGLRRPVDFLFVDEFQDTDDLQISLIKTVTEVAKAQLFVVGDIKQSIYRFRGANYTAFDELTKAFGSNKVDRTFKLKKNYRTEAIILEELERKFKSWRGHPEELLPKASGDGDILSPMINNDSSQVEVNLNLALSEKRKLENLIWELYDSIHEAKYEQKTVEFAILVRTNTQAYRLRDLLNSLRNKGKDLNYEVSVGGGLFKSVAAKDLLILVTSLYYQKDFASLFALTQTYFTEKNFDVKEMENFHGEFKSGQFEEIIKDVKGFNIAVEDFRLKPTLHVIHQFLLKNNFLEIMKNANVQLHEIERYQLNLLKILKLAEERHENQILNLKKLKEWLEMEVAINREEEEVDVETSHYGKVIKVITVHKAKGLEFHTVLIPYLDKKFNQWRSTEVLAKKEGKQVKVGWRLMVEGNGQIYSPHYWNIKNEEKKEIGREEARLLYVATTRAEKRLFVPTEVTGKNYKTSVECWNDLMKMGGGEIK